MNEPHINLYNLTKTEEQILHAMCEKGIGLKNIKDLEPELNLSFSTIKTHLQHIYEKSLCNSKAELIFNYQRAKESLFEQHLEDKKEAENYRKALEKIREILNDVIGCTFHDNDKLNDIRQKLIDILKYFER